MGRHAPASLDTLLATICASAKHWRLETTKRGERRVYHFRLWTNDSRRASGYGATPTLAVIRAMENLRPGKAIIDGFHAAGHAMAPRLRLAGVPST